MDSYLPRVEATCRAYLARWADQDCIDVQEEVRSPPAEPSGYQDNRAQLPSCRQYLDRWQTRTALTCRKRCAALNWAFWV